MTRHEWQNSLLSSFPDAKKSGKFFVSRCPGHDDKNPSLTILFKDTPEGARAQIQCKAGCDWNHVIASVGIQKKDLYFHTNGNGNGRNLKPKAYKAPPVEKRFLDIDFDHPTTIYSYQDETGQELYQNCRYETDRLGNRLEKKTFRQRHLVAKEWAYSLNGLRRLPYNLPGLIKEPSIIFDCEGEKDADNICTLGLTGTTTLKESFQEIHKYCRGKVIIICEDNDEPGRKKAVEKANAYWKAGAEAVKILQFREMPEASDVSDWLNLGYDIFDLVNLADPLPIYNPLQSVTIDFFREVVPRKPLIEIEERNALPSGNVGGLVAGIGQGKSHFIEILASTAIKPGCEPYSGLRVNLEENERVAILDTEQPGDDCKEILHRAFRRVGQNSDFLTPDGGEFKRLTVLSLIDLTLPERSEKLTMAMKRPEFKVIIIDGILDFVANPNDPAETAGFVLKLHTMAAKYNKGIFCVLHGNRDQTTGKGKGWLGDIFQRKATCFLMLRKHKNDPSIRVITTDFDNAKFRKGDDTGLNIAMQWDLDIQGFSCLPYPEESKDGKLSKEVIFTRCFSQQETLKKKELVAKYMKEAGVSKGTAYKHIDKAIGFYIEKIRTDKGFEYQLLPF